MSFWARNIGTGGRIYRLVIGIALLAGAFYLYQRNGGILPWLLAVAGVFGVFEAMRGWCLLRACKIKTPL